MTTFAMSTLGCKVNTYESQAYVQGLLELGYTEVDFKEKADIYIINTCAVTNTAGSKSRQKIHQAIRTNPEAFIAVVGCYVQTSSKEIADIEGVDLILGSDGKAGLALEVDQAYKQKKRLNLVHEIDNVKVFEALPIHRFTDHTRAFLKIQDGCNQFCSYCIIPYARGRERSLPMDDVIKTAKELVANQHYEIVLSGIHTGRYGHDLGTDLTALLRRLLNEVEGLQRIRLSSIEINELSDEFLTLMQQDERIARHLHIPIQSASNHVLKAMNRPYTIEAFIKRIDEIRALLPDCSISTDIIVGFPDESEEDFNETLSNLDRIQFSFMHVFPFSKRDGTKAAGMSNQISGLVKKERAKLLNVKSGNDYALYQQGWIGRRVSVLFEKQENQLAIGHASQYFPVTVMCDASVVNRFHNVIITGYENGMLQGKIEEVKG